MRNALTVAAVELRLFVRDRSNIFFVFVFPLLLVLMIGAQFGDSATAGRVAVSGTDGALRTELVTRLEDEDVVVVDQDWQAALDQLARGRLDVAVRVSAEADAAHDAGEPVTLEMVRGSAPQAPVVEQQVRGAVEQVRARSGQVMALAERGVPEDRAVAALDRARGEVEAPALDVVSVDRLSQEFDGLGQFDLGASGQLLLFTFLACLAGSATLIQARRLGVVARMLSGPVSTGQLIAGQTLGRWAIGLFQGGYIMVATSVLFGVSWGSLPLSLLVLAVFALVAAGAAILLGTLMENEGAASGAGVGLGLVLAALGGSMLPRELFPDTVRAISGLTPHAWAYEAFAEIQRRDGQLLDVLPQLGVLAAMAALLLTLGAWSLRRSLARAM